LSQKVFVATAKPDYAETIQLRLEISPSMNCEVTVMFSFSGLSRPINLVDFQSEPSFLGLQISATYFKGLESTSVIIGLNGSKVSTGQGRFIADMMAYELDRDFVIPDLMLTTTAYGEYSYISNYASTELRNAFLESLPSQGFAQILALMLSKNQNCSMHIGLGKEGGWSVRFYCDGGTKKLNPDQEQTISLKQITGYSDTIKPAPTSSSSTLRIEVRNRINREYDLTIYPISPTQMQERYQEDTPQYQSQYNLQGNSVEDLSIYLKITLILPTTTILIVATMIIIAAATIIIIKRHKPAQNY
jgi:hypothetical protein